MDTGGSASLLEADDAVESVGVGEGEGVHAEGGGLVDEVAGGGTAG